MADGLQILWGSFPIVLVLPTYLKDYWQCGDLQVMDHNTANALLVGDDHAIRHDLDSALIALWNEFKYKAIVTKSYSELEPIQCCPHQLNQMFLNLLIHGGRAIELFGDIHITIRHLDRKAGQGDFRVHMPVN